MAKKKKKRFPPPLTDAEIAAYHNGQEGKQGKVRGPHAAKHKLARRRAQKRRGLSGMTMKSSTPWLIGAGITALVLGAIWYWRRAPRRALLTKLACMETGVLARKAAAQSAGDAAGVAAEDRHLQNVYALRAQIEAGVPLEHLTLPGETPASIAAEFAKPCPS